MRIAIASGKGGTGKTLVSTNLFHILKKKGFKVMLVDCDAEAPNVVAFFDSQVASVDLVCHNVPVIDLQKCTFCGKCHEYCSYNAIFILPPVKMIKVLEDLCHGCGACSVACEFDAITEKEVPLGQVSTLVMNGSQSIIEARMNVGVMSPVPVIKKAIRSVYSNTDIVLLDSPPGTSCPFVQTVATSDFVILITEPTPFGLSDLRQSVEILKDMRKPCGVIINRAGMGDHSVMEYIHQENISFLGEIPFDKQIADFYSNGKLVSDHLTDFADLLFRIFQKIVRDYGNSSN